MFLDDHGKENTKLLLDCSNEMLDLELHGPGMFGLYMDGLGDIASDDRVIGNKQGFEAGESMALHCQVISCALMSLERLPWTPGILMDMRRCVRNSRIFLRSSLVGSQTIAGNFVVGSVMTSLASSGMVMVMMDDV